MFTHNLNFGTNIVIFKVKLMLKVLLLSKLIQNYYNLEFFKQNFINKKEHQKTSYYETTL